MPFPDDPLDVRADVWLGDVIGWVELPVRTGAGGGGVKIRRDRKPGAALPDPGTCSLLVSDPDGTWSPRNPRGLYFGRIGRNTPVRVSFDGRVRYRFTGEVASWTPRWSVSEKDRTVSIECAGVLRRILASSSPPRSAMRRAYTAAGPVAYWPLEDGQIATQAASDVSGHPAATITGPAAFADVADYAWGTPGSGAAGHLAFGVGQLVDLKGGGVVRAAVPATVTAATTWAWSVNIAAKTDSDKLAGDIVLVEVHCAGGTYPRWRLVQEVSPSYTVRMVAFTAAGAATNVAEVSGGVLGLSSWDVSVWQDGAQVKVGILLTRDDRDVPARAFTGLGAVPGTLAGVVELAVNPTQQTSTDETMSFGHLALFASSNTPDGVLQNWRDADGVLRYGPFYSHDRETATERLARLFSEVGVPAVVPSVARADSVIMGFQRPGTFAELVEQCVTADGGVLVEQRDGVGVVYRPRRTLYNAAAVVTLSYAAGHIAPPLAPVDDDDQVTNDVIVERVDGSSARSVEESGPLSVLSPPAGIGTYERTVRLAVRDDSQLADRAGWLRHLGTVDGSRYDAVTAAAATSLSIVSTAANGRWTIDPGAFPIDVMIGDGTTGEAVRLSAITGSGLTQTATVAPGGRALNGVARGWAAGASVIIIGAGRAAL